MLGLILLYFIGKSFYKLANECGKSPWAYAVLGIVVYLAVLYSSQYVFFYVIDLFDFYVMYLLISIALGLLAWWGLYGYLDKKWDRKVISSQDDVLDDVLFED